MLSAKPHHHPEHSHSYAATHPEEFDAALKRASEDGTLATWTYGQITGLVAPPDAPDWKR